MNILTFEQHPLDIELDSKETILVSLYDASSMECIVGASIVKQPPQYLLAFHSFMYAASHTSLTLAVTDLLAWFKTNNIRLDGLVIPLMLAKELGVSSLYNQLTTAELCGQPLNVFVYDTGQDVKDLIIKATTKLAVPISCPNRMQRIKCSNCAHN